MPFSQIVNAGIETYKSVKEITDNRKRNAYEQNISLLDYDQKKKLNDELIKAQTKEQRQQILDKALGQVEIQSTPSIFTSNENLKPALYVLGALIGFGIIFYIIKNKK